MHRLSLDGVWKLYHFCEFDLAVHRPDQLATSGLEPIDAMVPGNVELDLVRAGKLSDPFFGTNIFDLRQYETHQWWYVRSFDMPAARPDCEAVLTFEGLDCLATVWLNNRIVGTCENMLVPCSFDVTSHLHPVGRPNTLAVQIRSAVNAARSKRYEPSQVAMATNYEQLHVRKAPHMYGWDIAPRVVSAGLWRSVHLEHHEPVELLDVTHVRTTLEGDDATLWLSWHFRTKDSTLDRTELRFRGVCGSHRFEHVERPLFVAGRSQIRVSKAKLWWPKGYGEANLYELTCDLVVDGSVVDSRRETVGLRTVQLERTDITTATEPGQFLFRVNHVPIFCKGANWVPLDAFHSRDAQRLRPVLDLFDDLGCNIVRCWGGNVYEDTPFFRYCDEHGIMVWQDFAFACALYPQDEDFLRLVRNEAQTLVRRLRNHPSLILWCGDNEIDAAYIQHGLDPRCNRITREILPQVCAECDPYRPYLPSSPYASPEVVKRGGSERLMPEQHLWGPRDYFKGPFYSNNSAHFASELGYHGCPNVSSLRRFIPEDHLWPWQGNSYWYAHCTDPVQGGRDFAYRVALMANQIQEMFGAIPDTLESFVLASQISQAEAKKYFIEMFRLAKWRKSGIIWWNVMDCWPQFSDAVVDYYFSRKLAYWYIKRVQAPLCLMMDEPRDWHCRVAVANDTLEAHAGHFRVYDLLNEREVLSGSFQVEPNVTRDIGRVRVSHGEHRLFLLTWESNHLRGGNHYLLGKPPFSLSQYRGFLHHIAALPQPFDLQSAGPMP